MAAESTAVVGELVKRAVVAGLSPAVVAKWGGRNQGPWSACGGKATVSDLNLQASTETIFDLASLTKPLATTALAIMTMRPGSLELSSRAGSVLDELEGTPVGELTVQQMLTHTAGLPAWLPLYCLAEGDPGRLWSVLGSLVLRPADVEVEYSCIGFIVLGKMIEKIAGCGLDVLFRTQIARPLGLEREIGFAPDPEDDRLAGGAGQPVVEQRLVLEMGFDPGLIPVPGAGLPDDGNARFLGGVSGNAGLFGSADAVSKLAATWLGDTPEILTADEIELATSPATPGLEQERALGWQLAGSPGCSAGRSLSQRAFGHSGFTGTSLWIDPDLGGSFVLLTNRNHPSQRDTELHPLRRRFHTLAARFD